MAFKAENLTVHANNAKSGVVPSMAVYWNEDGDSDPTLVTAAYIDAFRGLKTGDQVLVVDADYLNNRYFNAAVDVANVVTLTLNVV